MSDTSEPIVVMAPAGADTRKGQVGAALEALSRECLVPMTITATPPPDAGCAMVIWFHRPTYAPTAAEIQWLERVVAAGVPVLPVVEALAGAGSMPLCIAAFNAMPLDRYGAAAAHAVADEVAGRLWLRRRQRKAFISYRRADSAAVAMQLNALLVAQRWSVFLDQHEIHWGDDYQTELMWALNDVDLVILLASPNSAASTWLMQEIAVARSRSIGLVPIVWPAAAGKTPVYIANLDARSAVDLAPEHFVGPSDAPSDQRLTAPAVDAIQEALYVERAHAITERGRSYVFDARRRLERRAVDGRVVALAGHGEFDCALPGPAGDEVTTVRYLPFRPTPADLFAAQRAAESEQRSVVCIYPENDPCDHRARALRWCAGAHPSSRVRLWAHNRRGFEVGP